MDFCSQFGMDPTAGGWPAWFAAMDSDAIAVSSYAESSFLEDVAETALAFAGAPSQADHTLYDELEAVFPARWAILEAQFPQ